MVHSWSAAGVVAVAAAAAPVSAGVVVYNFSLDGLQENPPVATPGFGTATVTLDTVTGDVSVTGSYSSLIGNATAAHIHGPAPVGMNAGVIFGLMITGGTDGTISGMGTLSMTDMQHMLDGNTYLNVHSSFAPGGEIRGQVVPAPGAAALLGLAGVVAARRRR